MAQSFARGPHVQLEQPKGNRGRGRARMALRWRPSFLAALSLTGSVMIACKAATVSFPTYSKHRKEDPDFASQCELADDMATQRLHDACFASAVEGDIEPIYWQGIKVGHVRKFDSRLRIEMLRARMPGKFKAPGAAVQINAGQGAQILVIGEAEKAELCANRRRYLEAIKAQRAEGVENPTLMP